MHCCVSAGQYSPSTRTMPSGQPSVRAATGNPGAGEAEDGADEAAGGADEAAGGAVDAADDGAATLALVAAGGAALDEPASAVLPQADATPTANTAEAERPGHAAA